MPSPRNMQLDSVERPLVIAHRGASGLAPENTLSAFRLAMALRADGIELDVQLTRDRKPVVIHDYQLNRTTDGAGPVGRLTLDQLRKLDASCWFEQRSARRARWASRRRSTVNHGGSSPRRESVPALEDVFALIASSGLRRVYVELKGKPENREAMLEAVLGLVQRFQIERLVTLLSFDHDILHRSKLRAADIRTAATIPARGGRLVSTRSMIRDAESANVDEVALHYALATRRTVDALQSSGFSVSGWTANSKLAMRRLLKCRVDSIMTNYPNRLREVLDSPSGRC